MVGNIRHLWILLICFGSAFSYRRLQREIPNGDRVPHPCGNGIWDAVGHAEPYHVMKKNAFGMMMKRNQLDWHKICREDADLDGKTNGEELGDPDCRWQKGDILPLPIGHPGFCEPDREFCYYNYTYPQCEHRDMRVYQGGRGGSPQTPVRTPPPHFGKHPQALLTERLNKQPGRFGPPRGRGSSFGGPGLQFGINDQQGSFGGFGPSQTQLSTGFDQGFESQGFGDSRASSGSLGISDPSFSGSFGASGQFELSSSRRSRPRSRSFDLRTDSTTSPAFDWSDPSGGFQSSPSRGFSGQFRGAEPAVSGSRFWQSSQAIPSRGIEPTRDSFATSLNQRFIQGGSSGFGRRSFMSPAGRGVLHRSVQRRIQQARDSHRPETSRFMERWRGSTMGAMEPQYPQFRGMSGGGGRGRGSRFIF